MSLSRLLATVLAFLFFYSVCTTAVHAASVVLSDPSLAFFDINRSIILSTTGESEPTSFGWRSRFSSYYNPDPAVSVATLTFTTPSYRTGTAVFEFLTVPYCVDASGDNQRCDLSGRVLYMLVRFRHHQEIYFQATIWQDATPASTQKYLDAFKAQLNRTDVVYPSAAGAMRMEDGATCTDMTDECYLASAATYTRSYKEIDPAQYSGRFLFRLGEKYSLNSPWRVRLQHKLPHDSEAEVDVVLVLNRLPAVNPLDSRWWLEGVGGRVALMAVSVLVAFGFLACTLEVAALLVRRRIANDAAIAPDTALYDSDDNEGHFAFLQRVAKVAASGVQKCADYTAAKARGLNFPTVCLKPFRCWRSRHRRLPTAEEGTAEMEREINTVSTSVLSVEEEAGPICRICRCQEPQNDLFAPCACNGSSKYVHHSCLERWREMTTNPEHRRVCAECKTPYTVVRVAVPRNTALITSSPIIEPVIRHYATTALCIALTVFFAVGGAYGLKSIFFFTTGLDSNVMWAFTHGYHWILTAYFLLALALNLNIMNPFVKDMEPAELQLFFVLLSLALLEIPISYGISAFLSLFFDYLFTWEISYGLGLISTAIIHLMDVFTNYFELLDSFLDEREVVAPRASPEGGQEQPSV